MFKYFAAVCLAVATLHCNGQDVEKRYLHYAGIQSNDLLRQLLNFSNSNTAITNPYTVVYSISDSRSRWGLHAGIGYNYKKTVDKEVPSSRVTKVNDLFFRLGIEKKYTLGKKFEGGYAFDITNGYQLDKTFTSSVTTNGSTTDSSISTVTNKINSYGAGPQLSVAFHITEKLLVGTESTLYVTSQKLKQNILVINTTTDLFNNEQTVSTSNSNGETDTTTFAITLPVAIFLIVRF